MKVWDPFTNDYANISSVIDVKGKDVNKSRFFQELNPINPNAWAHKIDADDELILYMVDPSSINSTDGNATYLFETGKNITEFELDNVLKKIFCDGTYLMADMNYAGNFIQGSLNKSNRVLIGSSAFNNKSRYWPMATMFHPAGSFFFNPFIEDLDFGGGTLLSAFDWATFSIPFPFQVNMTAIQAPVYIDNIGTFDIWSLLL